MDHQTTAEDMAASAIAYGTLLAAFAEFGVTRKAFAAAIVTIALTDAIEPPPRIYCTRWHQPGQHDRSCLPPAEPGNPELRLLRAIYGLCGQCDNEQPHTHETEGSTDARTVRDH